MKRNLITILLLLCSVLLMLGGVVLYRNLTAEPAAPAVSTVPVETPAADAPEEGTEIILPGMNEAGSDAEIISDDSDREKAADFTMTDRTGAQVRLSDFFGKPIIINFWATWCGPCQMELPYFDEAFGKYQDQIQFLMVDLADGAYETREGCIAFALDRGYSFPLYFDEFGEGSEAYGISAIPYTLVIDADGRIVDSHLGSMSSADLQKLIDALISGS